jgi:PTH1 family peptidyl-tRNA hydrolase
VVRHLGTTEFPRLRVGIRGERYSRDRDLADYVLESLPKAEREVFEESIARAAEAIRIWLTHGIDAAMRRANVQPSSPDGLDPD